MDKIEVKIVNRVCPMCNNPNFGRISARSQIQSLIYKAIRDE